MNLWHDFKTNNQNLIYKWTHYFPIYERHLKAWQGKTVTIMEIGVSKGGSLQMWQRYLGPLATIVGLDIDPNCAKLSNPQDNIHVRIGNQSNINFLQRVLDEFGTPDIIIDDGSHKMTDINQSFAFLYPKLSKNGIYLVEDLHTAYWSEFGGEVTNPNTFINVSKNLIDQLNADHSRGAVESNFFTKNTFSINYYDSVVVFERGTIPNKNAQKIGN